jgi:hypothetical protein
VTVATSQSPLLQSAREGRDTVSMTPMCTLMIGSLDDLVKVLVERDDIALDPSAASWAGIAVSKRAYGTSASAATGRACWPRPTGIGCTGPSWWAGTWR